MEEVACAVATVWRVADGGVAGGRGGGGSVAGVESIAIMVRLN